MNPTANPLTHDFWHTIFPRLAEITDPAWQSARAASQLYEFPQGSVMMRPGEASPGFVLIAKGCMRVYQRAQNGREIALYRAQAGEICLLTLANLLNNTTYSAEAMAEEAVSAVIIPLADFQKALKDSEEFRLTLFATLSLRLSDMMHLIGRVAFQPLDMRLANLLVQRFEEDKATLLRVTHQKLAYELGTTREVTSRLLKEFEQLGCIRLNRGSIELLSVKDLALLTKSAVV